MLFFHLWKMFPHKGTLKPDTVDVISPVAVLHVTKWASWCSFSVSAHFIVGSSSMFPRSVAVASLLSNDLFSWAVILLLPLSHDWSVQLMFNTLQPSCTGWLFCKLIRCGVAVTMRQHEKSDGNSLFPFCFVHGTGDYSGSKLVQPCSRQTCQHTEVDGRPIVVLIMIDHWYVGRWGRILCHFFTVL